MIARKPVFIVSIMHIGDAFEACRQSLSHVYLTNIPLAPGLWSARHHEFAIFRKEIHHRIEVVCVECGNKLLERLNPLQGAGLSLSVGQQTPKRTGPQRTSAT